MEKRYNPRTVEQKWYDFWESKGLFHVCVNHQKAPFSVIIPPPNVTGGLTMGHVMDTVPQDIIVRWKRMQGYEALWLPGTDHAGIATQNVVEKELASKGLTRHGLGRKEFLEGVWAWKEEHGSRIIDQLKRLGCSCDWQRERFTMDEGLSRAVREAFVRLYDKGLVYKGKYIINWCPRCRTALSDEESEHKEVDGHLWYIRYSIKGSREHITVATTRPETMLGDVALAISPQDKRYKHLLGKTAILPLVGRELAVIEDDSVNPKFGTGIVKVTPAHDPNDFEMGQRHGLEPILVMNEDGAMNGNAGNYAGLDRFECRKAVLEDLERQKLIEKVKPHRHSVGHCYRCNTMVEPYLSDQWFVKMRPLALPAIEAVKDGRIKFYPKRWTNVYLNWMENIRNWCISRQIWWGHRIPVWYCRQCGQVVVNREEPSGCPRCSGEDLVQDEDVLDTWFSSWLWPFSTLGWPEEAEDLEYFYPISFQTAGQDIIFFWIARMIMAGLEFTGQPPFPEIYIHGMVKDEQGRWMSKSLGNSPDPLEIIDEYGADAVRFSMVFITAEGQDAYFSEGRVEVGRNFANKIWNAARLVLMNTRDFDPGDIELDGLNLTLADRWILSCYNRVVERITASLSQYRFNEAAHTLYDFVWHQYCDWYLELTKSRFYRPNNRVDGDTARFVALFVLDGFLRLLHPFIPFITEELWQQFRHEFGQALPESIVIAKWPEVDERLFDQKAEEQMNTIQAVIDQIRNIRGEINIPLSKRTDVLIKGGEGEALKCLHRNRHYLFDLAKVGSLTVGKDLAKPKISASGVVGDLEIYLPLEGLFDLEVERARLEKEIDRVSKQLEGVRKKLMNEDFLQRAPKEVVEREKKKGKDYQSKLEKLERNLGVVLGSE